MNGSFDLTGAIADIFTLDGSEETFEDFIGIDELGIFDSSEAFLEQLDLNSSDQENEGLGSSEHIFPWKLHLMLEEAEANNFQSIVSWVQDGTAFKVHNTTEFLTHVMPRYFDQSKFESFRRQLNLYGFSRITRGENRGVYFHKSFVKSDRALCKEISRQSSKKMTLVPYSYDGSCGLVMTKTIDMILGRQWVPLIK